MDFNENIPDWKEITPPFSGLLALSMLGWVVVSIFQKLDPERYIYFGTLLGSGMITAYQLHNSQRNKNPIQNGGIIFFIILWLGMFSFVDKEVTVDLIIFIINLPQLLFIAITPLTIIWVRPYNVERFFGMQVLDDYTKIHSTWKYSVIIVILINLFNLKVLFQTIPSILFEFLILIPMIAETIQLQNKNKKSLPMLTLFVQEELFSKFAVPISILKSVFFIMVIFIFELVNSSIWLLVILGYFVGLALWFFDFIIPSEDESLENDLSKFGENIEQFVSNTMKDVSDTTTKLVSDINTQIIIPSTTTKIKDTSIKQFESINKNLVSSDSTIQEKAHTLGRKVRSGIEKPYYTLNHILSTLTAEDFSSAWRVSNPGLSFRSKKGEWTPPLGLILFPIELENYDFRRSDQVLLLGFNKPVKTKNTKVSISVGEEKKYNMRITDNSIQIGDIEFNTRSLIVDKEEWQKIKSYLELVRDDDDIMYTGFKTLKEMQEVLLSLSDKWITLRETAQEVVVNFVAGLLGTSEPIFIPKENIAGLIESEDNSDDYVIRDLD